MAALCLVSSFAAAQTNQPITLSDDLNDADWMSSRAGEWRMGISSDYSSVAAGAVNFNGVKGNSGLQEADTSFMSETPLNKAWFVPLGLVLRNLFLGTVSGAPIPNHINTLGFDSGLGYHLNDDWTITGALGPRFYRLDAVDSSGIGVGRSVRATYQWAPNLTLTLGLAVDANRDLPVLPLGGLRWGIRSNLTLNVTFPRSGLVYRPNANLNLMAGFDGDFTVFRAENNLGDQIGRSQYNNGLGTYREFRLGVGAEYRITGGLSASIKGGYSFDRELDYQRIGQSVNFGSALFIRAGLKYRF